MRQDKPALAETAVDPPDAALSAFADVPLTSPGFVDGTLSYTTHDAMADFLVSLARRSHRARLSSLGRSQLGRDPLQPALDGGRVAAPGAAIARADPDLAVEGEAQAVRGREAEQERWHRVQ